MNNIIIPENETLLSCGSKISEKRDDGGLIHNGLIHYIQGKMDFASKHSIYMVLTMVPEIFPLNMKELFEKEDFVATAKQNKVFQKINKELLIPIDGHQLVEIIELAKQYIFEATNE